MMTQEEMVLRLGQMDRELDRVEECRRVGSIGEAMQRLTAAVRLQLSVLRPVAVAVLPGEKQEAPKAVLRRHMGQTIAECDCPTPDVCEEAARCVIGEPAPVAIVTDDQVRAFARPCRWPDPGVFEMLMNAAHTIETLSRDMCEARKKIARLEQEALPPRWR